MKILNNRTKLGLLVLLHLPFVLVRLPGLFTSNGLWLDEIWTMITANPGNSLQDIIDSSASDVSPPLYYILLKFFLSAFGVTDFSARLFSVLLAVSANVILTLVALKIGKLNLAAWLLALTTFNLFLVQYAAEVRFYALVLFLVSLFILVYYSIRFEQNKSVFLLALLPLIVSLSLYTHYHAAFFYFGIGVFELYCTIKCWLKDRTVKKASLFVVAGLLVGVVMFIPWALVLAKQLSKGGTGWLGLPGFDSLFEFWYVIASKNTLAFLFWIGGLVLFFRSKGAVQERQIAAPFGWAILCTWLLPFLVSFILVPMFLPRYVILLMPAWLLVVALGLGQIREKLQRPLFITLYLGCFAWIFILQKVHQPKIRDSFKEASFLVSERMSSEKEPVFSTFAWCNNYYFQQLGDVRAKEVADTLFPVAIAPTDPKAIQSFWLITHLNYQWGHDTLRIASLQPTYQIASVDTLERGYVYHYELALDK